MRNLLWRSQESALTSDFITTSNPPLANRSQAVSPGVRADFGLSRNVLWNQINTACGCVCIPLLETSLQQRKAGVRQAGWGVRGISRFAFSKRTHQVVENRRRCPESDKTNPRTHQVVENACLTSSLSYAIQRMRVISAQSRPITRATGAGHRSLASGAGLGPGSALRGESRNSIDAVQWCP